jgi:hypothetical protein
MARAAWYLGVPPVVAEFVVADGTVHRIGWRRGRLVLVDHPDPTGELALAALGGHRCVCFDVLDAWRTRPRDVLYRAMEWSGHAFGWVGPSSPAALDAQARAQLLSAIAGRRSSAIAHQLEEQLSEQLLAMLPPVLIERIACALLVRELRAGRTTTVLPGLSIRDQVVEALRQCIRSWGPHRRPPTVDLDLWVTDEVAPDVLGLVERDLGYAMAILPEHWLVAVHARHLDVVDGCFVIDARLDRADAGEVDAVVFEHSGAWGWTPVRQSLPVTRTRSGTWHITGSPPQAT